MYSKYATALTVSLVVAVVLTAATVFYLARRVAALPDEARIQALIEARLERQPSAREIGAPIDQRPAQRNAARPGAPAAAARGLTEKEVLDLIDKRLAQRNAGTLSDKEFGARVEQSILAFIEKQRRAEQERPNQLAKNVPRPGPEDHVYGKPDAAVSLIEYSDFECPYCKRFHLTAKQLVDDSNGQVHWVYRHFPLESHNPGAQKQAEAAECAAALGGNNAFWKYTDTIYARTQSGGRGFPLENLVPLAAELGLDREAFRKCLDSGRMAARVQRDFQTGVNAGVGGTPGNILLNNRTGQVIALPGARSYEQLKSAADQLLKGNP